MVVMVSWVYMDVKTYQLVYFKYVQFIVWQLHLNKHVLKKNIATLKEWNCKPQSRKRNLQQI